MSRPTVGPAPGEQASAGAGGLVAAPGAVAAAGCDVTEPVVAAALGTRRHRITHTTCAQHLRRAGRRALLAGPGEPERDAVLVADHAESVCDAQRVRATLGKLPAEQRIGVLLVDRDGYDRRSAARVRGVPRGTIASRLSVARTQLRTTLGRGSAPRPEGR